ncbi:MAG: sulfate reduction electron transfer complex DsrMKJOP subunit DsrK [bacterium]
MSSGFPKNFPAPEDLAAVDLEKKHLKNWMDPSVNFEGRRGTWSYPAAAKNLRYLGLPNPREWSPTDDDWKLPDRWQDTVLDGMADRLERFRSFQVMMDICVRCGACADKCHFFIGSGDPKNMPVLRAELLRSIYRRHFTTTGKILKSLAGGRELTAEVMKEWYYYFFQCTECRRCSVFCPYGIDTAEVTMIARELMNLIGLNINWVLEPAANCQRTGNHLGIEPHAFVDNIDFFLDEIEENTGFRPEVPINKKGADVLFVTPSGDIFADPAIYTLMGYFLLFDFLKKEHGFNWTMSAYASEGGNFGLFTSNEMIKRLNAKMYREADRLGVKWILGGECGHMWRVVNQYMDTMNGPAPSKMIVPKSPFTPTIFENAASTKMVHITEFTADLIKHNMLPLDPSRNDRYRVTFHDSCNPARGMGLFEEPRYILRNVCNNYWDMPESTIRENTFCCGGGAGLGNDENFEMRMRGGLPRGNAVKYVRDKHGVNLLTCVCAIDKATLVPVCDYWAEGVGVAGIHELVANALVFKKGEERKLNLRGEPLKDEEEAAAETEGNDA